MTEKPYPPEVLDVQRLAGVKSTPETATLGTGFANQADGCALRPDVEPDRAKEILARLARHVSPGDWAKAVEENPKWDGDLIPLNAKT